MTESVSLHRLSPIGAPATIDHRGVNWSMVRSTSYVIRQHFRYEYTGPVRDLKQRLMIVPPQRHGDQRLLAHHVEVSVPTVERRRTTDAFGNVVLALDVPHVERMIDFTASIEVERARNVQPTVMVARQASSAAWRAHTRLTEPDADLRAAADALRGTLAPPIDLAMRINQWVYGQMRYQFGVTEVHTTAAEAFALRLGVCQDYAHVMLALCRLCDLPARYVSGHLLGEGGTHAWVEVLIPDADRPYRLTARAFDPTHGCETDFRYITIAVGRDYFDVAPTSGTYFAVAPTSGTYFAECTGALSTTKHAGVSSITYFS